MNQLTPYERSGAPRAPVPAGRAADRADERDDARQFVTFTIDDEEYGLDIMAVREIKAWAGATRLPNAPAHMRGVINLRGLIVPVFDLRARFGAAMTEATKLHVVIILAVGARIVGVLVDAVSDILDVSARAIQPVPRLDRTIDADFLSGLISVEERMVALLDADALFDARDIPADNELKHLEQAAAETV